MQLHFSPSMRSITISSSSNGGNGNGGVGDLMKIKVAARHISYRTLFHTILILAFLLPFVFILTALVTLEGVNKCSTFDCLGRRLGPKLLGRTDDSGMERSEREIRESKFAELMNKHFAASAIPKSIHCLSLRLTDEYSSNAHARRQLPSPELLPLLSDNSYHHFVLSTDNILAASVVV
ncbi:UNVERIFIED_CONTAM: putative galacturonosyltransferase 13 [Sesamum radiatum]|uniref:Galacturonosyltransferase 13 n=1 Tax=Sesamum radiatum TaxID=300843 RepID=A0AAW2VTT0_SESRA